MVNFDNVLRRIGEFGKAQILLYILIGLCGIPTGEQNLSSVFTGASQDHWCRVPQLEHLASAEARKNLSIPRLSDGSFAQCRQFADVDLRENASIAAWWPEEDGSGNGSAAGADRLLRNCDEWEFDRTVIFSTVGSQFNLVCEHSFAVKMITSIYMTGFLIGCTLSGLLSDRIGRIKTVAITAVGQTLFGILAAVIPVLPVHIICRFLVGACTAGTFTTAFVISMEIIGPKYRMQPGIFVQGFFAAGFILVACLAYFIRNHVTLQIVLAVQPVVFVLYYWFYPESPRWLVSQGRYEEASEICKRLAKLNGKEVPDNFSITEEPFEMDMPPDAKVKVKEVAGHKKQGGSVIDLLRTPNMRKRSLNVFFNWFVVSLVYYGLSLNAEDLGGSVYVNTILSGIVEFPAYAMCCLTLNRFGRVRMHVITMVVGGIACIVAAFINLLWLKITLAMLGKFSVSAAFAIIYVYSAEVFPTVIRNAGVGMASTCARIGGLLAPQIVLLDFLWKPLPFVLVGVLAVGAGLLALLLPETLRQPLPESIEDGENFGQSKITQVQLEIEP